ncbi:hypothetical protein SAMN05518668_109138 [Sphingobium sp. YR657]|nr:hypothetical protein SAMN05518668_109138 [Sphingobium sp. YR657]
MGRKRHAMIDIDGRAIELLVHGADVQDRDGAPAGRSALAAS